jgi:DNA polymerase I-like protein with 3'-5' exonuclease and polymerase domains
MFKIKDTKVNYNVVSTPYQFINMVNKLPNLISCDFETSSIYSEDYKAYCKQRLETEDLSAKEVIELEKIIDSSGLDYPGIVRITHLSIGISPTKAIVAVVNDSYMDNLICQVLANTTKTTVWHNAGFDLKIIMHRTDKVPENYEDTYLMAKALTNHVDNWRYPLGLKDLMKHQFSEWAMDKTEFTYENRLNPKMLEYAAIDACATYQLYLDLQEEFSERRAG